MNNVEKTIKSSDNTNVIYVSSHKPIDFSKLAQDNALRIVLVGRPTRRQKLLKESVGNMSNNSDECSLCHRKLTSAAA